MFSAFFLSKGEAYVRHDASDDTYASGPVRFRNGYVRGRRRTETDGDGGDGGGGGGDGGDGRRRTGRTETDGDGRRRTGRSETDGDGGDGGDGRRRHLCVAHRTLWTDMAGDRDNLRLRLYLTPESFSAMEAPLHGSAGSRVVRTRPVPA